AGSRLSPLTLQRAKPAVPLGGKFRLIDIPISNCINSGLTHIYILTQFNSAPLHRHISKSYHFDRFSRGFVEILAAQQSPSYSAEGSWYQGTADAVRKNLQRFREAGGEEILILSGDQIYKMDFGDILATHHGRDGASKADVTIGTVLVPKERSRDLGVLKTETDGTVKAFIEKPGLDESLYSGLDASPDLLARFGMPRGGEPSYLANMGIYVFNLDVLEKALDNDSTDFGKEVLPSLLRDYDVRAHAFHGYWEDIGTIKAFHQANLELAQEKPSFDFYDEDSPVYTRARLLPAARLQNVTVRSSLLSDAARIKDAVIENSLIGLRSVIGENCRITSTYVMGCDFFESDEDREEARRQGIPALGIGEGTVIDGAIIDKDARIGRNVRIVNEAGHKEYDDGIVLIRDGISVVPRGGVVPDGYTV
ncbi:MAG: sugar phosphate nucleotidyltransferase, partial [Planctomycetota bacterium]